MFNPREVLRRFIKYTVLVLILLLSLLNTAKLQSSEIIIILSIISITYCLLDIIAPSIEINKS